jgi:hypothetical protein
LDFNLQREPSAPIGRPLIGEESINQRIPPFAPDQRILPEMTFQAKPDASEELA